MSIVDLQKFKGMVRLGQFQLRGIGSGEKEERETDAVKRVKLRLVR